MVNVVIIIIPINVISHDAQKYRGPRYTRYFHDTMCFVNILYLRIFPVKFHEIGSILNFMKRSYQLKQRAESQGQTRQKIVEAAIELHQTKGIAATTMNDIAAKANVGKVTVYRHFPDEGALVNACSGQYFQRHPFPNPEEWRCIEDAAERFRRGLRDTYAYHRATEPMIAKVLPDARDLPIMDPYHAHWQLAADVLEAAWPAPARRSPLLKASLALALSFDTWQFLVRRQRLSDNQAIKLMMRLTCDCPPQQK
jgi:AcrR family transcriptional regulator